MEARSREIPVDTARAGSVLQSDPALRLYAVGPVNIVTQGENLNNSSVVLRLVFGATSVLLPGDAEEKSEQVIARAYGAFLQSDILKAGHHGSKTSSSDAWLAAVQPRTAIISVGRKNRFGHPSPGTLGRLDRNGIALVRTDEEGAVIFGSDGIEWKRLDWREGS